MVTLKHDVLFQNRVVNLLILNQDILPNRLKSIQLLIILQLSQEHLAKSAPTNDHEEGEVFECSLFLRFFTFYEFGGPEVIFILLRQLPILLQTLGLEHVIEMVHQVVEVFIIVQEAVFVCLIQNLLILWSLNTHGLFELA